MNDHSDPGTKSQQGQIGYGHEFQAPQRLTQAKPSYIIKLVLNDLLKG